MGEMISKGLPTLTDFQLAFLLHLYISLSDNSNIIKIRPNKVHFPLTLKQVSQQIGGVLNVIKISPEHILFGEKCYLSHDNYLDNSVLVFDDSILFQGSKYPDSLTSEIANYKSGEWGISLLFKNENKGTALDVKHFLEAYRDQYIEEHSENDYESIKAGERRLISLTYHRLGILDLDFGENGNDMLIALIFHILGYSVEPPEINILKSPEMEYFPYPIHFESNFVFFDNIFKPLVEVNISKGVVQINNSFVLSDAIVEDATKIITFLIQESPMTHIGDILEYLDPQTAPTARLCAKLKTKLNRMRETIIKQTGYDLFLSIGRAKVELNTDLRVNIAKDTNSVE